MKPHYRWSWELSQRVLIGFRGTLEGIEGGVTYRLLDFVKPEHMPPELIETTLEWFH